jgi:hypothetical protein
MARDRIHPLKIEGADTGGTQEDEFPTAADPNEDHVDARGSTYQNDTSDDEDVGVERDSSDNLVLRDKNVPGGPKTLSALISGGFDINDIVWDNPGGIVYDSSGLAVTRG